MDFFRDMLLVWNFLGLVFDVFWIGEELNMWKIFVYLSLIVKDVDSNLCDSFVIVYVFFNIRCFFSK